MEVLYRDWEKFLKGEVSEGKFYEKTEIEATINNFMNSGVTLEHSVQHQIKRFIENKL